MLGIPVIGSLDNCGTSSAKMPSSSSKMIKFTTPTDWAGITESIPVISINAYNFFRGSAFSYHLN
ncbi:hypothetical protein BDK88_0046 [Natrinema hispanicum]|uniref:Uncharacterized protein n=1 Tax=Natrinema hispanicum TaxID=392421 RepID=A0A482YEF6_9EURY|nr:hypothetical protein BDK88_0046 [Natrinema hispanicum]